jgi:hypothetical protein
MYLHRQALLQYLGHWQLLLRPQFEELLGLSKFKYVTKTVPPSFVSCLGTWENLQVNNIEVNNKPGGEDSGSLFSRFFCSSSIHFIHCSCTLIFLVWFTGSTAVSHFFLFATISLEKNINQRSQWVKLSQEGRRFL